MIGIRDIYLCEEMTADPAEQNGTLGPKYFCTSLCLVNKAARLITFLDTLWMMAPEVPSQQCVPPEASGLRVYTRVFVNLRLILKIYRCPRILPTLTPEKISRPT